MNKAIVAVDGTVWDGSIDIVLGKKIYHGPPRDISIVETCPVFTANMEIDSIIQEGEVIPVLGWTRLNMYKTDDRYWVTGEGGHIPVHSVSEKPV